MLRCAAPQRLSHFGGNRDFGISECGFVEEVTGLEEVERGPQIDSGGGGLFVLCLSSAVSMRMVDGDGHSLVP